MEIFYSVPVSVYMLNYAFLGCLPYPANIGIYIIL